MLPVAAFGWLLLPLLSWQSDAARPGLCNFDTTCDWKWSSVNDTTIKVVTDPALAPRAPESDVSKTRDGKYLWISQQGAAQLRSSIMQHTDSHCYLSLYIYQVEMKQGKISLILETSNKTILAVEHSGNNTGRWEPKRFNLGETSQSFNIMIEILLPFDNSSVAVDNIQLIDCFSNTRTLDHTECTETMFRCSNDSCLKRDHVCDLTPDCVNGSDELGECDKVPKYAKCTFESGWCGWINDSGHPQVKWERHKGSIPSDRSEPKNDHSYRNATYAYVNLQGTELGIQGTIKSPIFNPTPPYHNDPTSLYYKSCKVRFSCFGTAQLSLSLVQLRAHQNHSNFIFWSKGSSASWKSEVVTLPDIRYKYFLQFEASKSYTFKSYFAIDDISLSPECFGVGVPPEVLGDFNYYDQKIPSWDDLPPKHIDFTNETIIKIGTCGQTGRMGPTPEQCLEFNNGTNVVVLSEATKNERDARLRYEGIQRWTAPRGGYYTIIAMGARGGMGALAMGVSLGAMVHGVVELEKGQQLYFMIGQPGTDACPKTLGTKTNTCQQARTVNLTSPAKSSVHEVRHTELTDGGGGGGGATYIFTLEPHGKQQPLLIAGGGGGLGPTKFIDDDVQHAKGMLPSNRQAFNGASYKNNSGGGGGWTRKSSNETNHVANGMALTEGGIGGVGCGSNDKGLGNGGFGGGGGGCLSGGGGGGYAGGDTGYKGSGNGEGGYSFASLDLLLVSYIEKANSGPGEAYIIPAISGCGCDFRCAVIDKHLSKTRCFCPSGWVLGNDTKSCIRLNDSDSEHNRVTIALVCVIIFLVVAVSILCIVLYNRYQKRKTSERRRQLMFGNGTELRSMRFVSDSMMTEFNPNYEFAGSLYSFKDLPQIPRDNITLVKPLGQGAFGEVFQGIYKYRSNEEHPVAVKTLPSLSTSQAEADFMMEALIMSKFNHPNIVHFIGVSFDKHPRYIVLELLAGGDLKNFLREERPRPDRTTMLTMQNLIMCAYDVAKGCKYMEEARFIHRDIAARNCLLTCKGPGRVVKIADFGMARDIYRSDYYRKGGKAMLPIKWMPPESFLDGIFTTKTDVWAFGVLLWEIMSFGYMPYTGCANREVMSMVTSGGRLERPAGCPDPIYGIMTRCWHPHPEERPSFSNIVERIGYCLQDPDVINHPTPNYDLLPICDREITIMRPDPETECINMHPDLDGCGYMQPRMNFRPATYRIGQPPGIVYASLSHPADDRENRNHFNREISHGAEDSPPREHYHKHSSAPDEHDLDDICDNRQNCKRQLDNENELNANVMVNSLSHQESTATSNTANDTNNTNEQTKSQEGGHNGNGESTTTTDTKSDSLFMASTGTPPDTVSSSPNTRTSSPNHAANAANNGNGSPSNMNGIIRKNALTARLSLDPSALCRGTIPYEKIAFSPPKARLSNAGSTEVRKDSLGHELPREEECSC